MEIRKLFSRSFGPFLATLFLFCSISQAASDDVSLAWDPSISPNISKYKLYIGNASRSYSAVVMLGNQTTYVVTDLNPGTWYFAVTAVDMDGNESDFSNEVSQIIDSGGSTGPTCNINGDSSVDVLDLQALVNVILGINPSSSSYDLNSDQRVDVLDLQILNNVILGLRSCP